MSASPVARQATQCQSIPSRRVVINDASQLPADYSSTPGGTLYSTTPGGTRIVYDRAFLMQLRNSPLARTPPKNLSSIPSDLIKGANVPKDDIKTEVEPILEEPQDQFAIEL